MHARRRRRHEGSRRKAEKRKANIEQIKMCECVRMRPLTVCVCRFARFFQQTENDFLLTRRRAVCVCRLRFVCALHSMCMRCWSLVRSLLPAAYRGCHFVSLPSACNHIFRALDAIYRDTQSHIISRLPFLIYYISMYLY